MSDHPATSTRYDHDRNALETLLGDELPDLKRYRIDQIWEWLYTTPRDPAEWTNLPVRLREHLAELLPSALRPAAESISEGGQTVKFLSELTDGHLIETVLMLSPRRVTVCISSQAGCAMACGFCATGQAGFSRHLTTGEIVEQVVRAEMRAQQMQRRVSNVVFMGMGEPLANPERVIEAIERLHGDLGLSARNLTVSTVGVIPGIRTLAAHRLPVNLAVSLHAANDDKRNELVPINRRYPIDDLIAACTDYLSAKNRRISFEWAMIDGVNDTDDDARELAGLARRLRPSAHVNLIPLNPTPGFATRGTPLDQVHRFRDRLEHLGVNATVRRNRGTDIDAACGQLAAGQPVRLTGGRRPRHETAPDQR